MMIKFLFQSSSPGSGVVSIFLCFPVLNFNKFSSYFLEWKNPPPWEPQPTMLYFLPFPDQPTYPAGRVACDYTRKLWHQTTLFFEESLPSNGVGRSYDVVVMMIGSTPGGWKAAGPLCVLPTTTFFRSEWVNPKPCAFSAFSTGPAKRELPVTSLAPEKPTTIHQQNIIILCIPNNYLALLLPFVESLPYQESSMLEMHQEIDIFCAYLPCLVSLGWMPDPDPWLAEADNKRETLHEQINPRSYTEATSWTPVALPL